eukprot:TRINITY_DN31189_c0_g1_i1.p1 TRINITY_DN31189_c0_g1~~TRINITY_DN31189_c0_g1_i1.p1  ORF type:complete len:120 (-),score=41.12 TRINITY_DN31189_c0_g1_i1:88-447(-)
MFVQMEREGKIIMQTHVVKFVNFKPLFFFSSRRRHTRCREVSWARRCVQETGTWAVYVPYPTLREGRPSEEGFDEAKLNLVDDFINKEVAKGFPGAVLIIARNGKIVKRGVYGLSLIHI